MSSFFAAVTVLAVIGVVLVGLTALAQRLVVFRPDAQAILRG